MSEITPDHIASAVRGLGLRTSTDMFLHQIRSQHRGHDAFASRVIVQAVDAVMRERVALIHMQHAHTDEQRQSAQAELAEARKAFNE